MLENAVGWLLQVGANIATLLVYVTIGAMLLTAWRRTLGRPRALARVVTSLATNMQVDYFIEQLGTPAFRKGQDQDDLVWVRPDALIRAMEDSGTVMMYAVTTRTRRFAPTFMRSHVISLDGETLEIKLGRTRFSDLPHGPFHVYGETTARRQGYGEVYEFGNPGGYQTYVYAINDAGWIPPSSGGLVQALADHSSVDARRSIGATDALAELDDGIETQRRDAAFNTFAILSPAWSDRVRDLGFTPGPDRDLVRLALYTRGLSWLDSMRLRLRRG